MQTTIMIAVTVDHDGSLTPLELAQTIGVWADTMAEDHPHIDTTPDEDQDHEVTVTILGCSGAIPVPIGYHGR